MTVDASRSCLGLATCVGGDGPADSGCEGSPDRGRASGAARKWVAKSIAGAPPLPVITRFLGSACLYCDLAGDGPDKAGEFAGDCGGDDIGGFAGPGEFAIARAQPHLSLPGDVADRLGWSSWRSCNSRLIRAGKR